MCCVVGISRLREGFGCGGEGVLPRALRRVFLTRLSFGEEWGVSDGHGVGLGGRQIDWRLVGIEISNSLFLSFE